MPGFKYEQPPTDKKLNPRSVELDQLPKHLDCNSGKIYSQILKAVEGVSHLFIKEISHHTRDLTMQTIVGSIRDTLENSKEITHILYKKDKDVFYFTELDHMEGTPAVYESLSALLDDYYHNRFQNNLIRQKAQDYVHVIDREYERVERKIDKLKEDLKEAEVKDKYQKYGELITAYMHEIRRYDKEAVVLDYYTNEEITIPLDPEIAPNDNAQRYYRRYNKLKNRGTTARDQLEKAYSDRDYFLNLLHQVDAITTSDEVEEIREELVEEGILKFKSSNKTDRKSVLKGK